MVPLTHLEGCSVGVFGLARSGLASVRAAVEGGAAKVFAWDDAQAARDAAERLGATILPPDDWSWADLKSLVLAPGVPLTHPAPHPVVELARAAGVEAICDIELLYREAPGRARFVAITGTNGKSTTTALIGHMLKSCGLDAEVGGNIGRSALDLGPPRDGRIYVLEVSSYQLDLTRRFRPNVGAWLNLTPDHLDRHGDMDGYRRAKERVFAQMTPADTAVIGIDEAVMEDVAAALTARGGPMVVSVSVARSPDAGLVVTGDGALFGNGERLGSLADLPTLRGRHNWQNAAVAFGAVRALGLPPQDILSAMATFPGLAHRMEVVGRQGRVIFVNDSKATNADAAAKALDTFEPIYWIAGGIAKEGGIASLGGYFPRVAKAYLIGAAADAFSATLSGRVPHVIAGDLETAVRLAAEDAALDPAPEPAVLLSPACASFDQFSDFEARGAAFRAAFAALAPQPPVLEFAT
jgi:UDP-N-acetylmuramoylalanine--D-glutamate ligase